MQKLAEVCVRRPVFASMLIAAIVVVGGVCFTQLGVDRYPRIETPVVSVTTSNPGATLRASKRRSPTASRPRSTGRRHRRAAIDLDRGPVAGDHHVRPLEEPRRRRAGGSRQGRPVFATPETPTAGRPEAGPGLDADHDVLDLGAAARGRAPASWSRTSRSAWNRSTASAR